MPETVALLAELAPRGRAGPRGRSEPGADHGLSPGAPGASDRHQPGCRARPAGRRRWQAPHRRAGAPRRVPSAGRGGAARRIAGDRGAPHRALSDPHARHVLRQPRACRPGGGMGPCRGDTGCRAGRGQPARRADHRGERFLPGRHGDRARTRRTARRGAPALAAGRHPVRLCRVQPAPRRLCAGDGAGGAGDRGRRHRERRVSASAAPRPVRAASSRPRRPWPARSRREAVFREAAAIAAAADRAAGRSASRRTIPARAGRGDGRSGRCARACA